MSNEIKKTVMELLDDIQKTDVSQDRLQLSHAILYLLQSASIVKNFDD